MEYLKKSEELENRMWYSRLAKDSFLYVGTYKRAVDEIEQLKTEAWAIFMDSETSQSEKIHAIRELHSLTKTYVLLLKDLPFVTNLSKYYEFSKLDNFPHGKSSSINKDNKQNSTANPLKNGKISEYEKLDDSFNYNIDKDKKSECNSKDDNNVTSKYENMDDEIMEKMQSQIHTPDYSKDERIGEITDENIDKIITPEHKESIRKLKDVLDI